MNTERCQPRLWCRVGAAAITLVMSWVAAAQPIDPATVEDAAASTEAEMKPYSEVISGPNVRFTMLPIRGGEFLMGSAEGEEGRKDDEGPRVKVKVEPFWMGRCEVTWDEYEVFMLSLDIDRRRKTGEPATALDAAADGVSRPTLPYTDMTFDMGKSGYPAIAMTHLAARQYTKWLSAKTGRFYRLPTEAEWEYAARAGSDTAYSSGDDPAGLAEYGWFFDNAQDKYQKVGTKEPNAFGLHDMHGNVWEWCLDSYEADRYVKLAEAAKGRGGVVGVMEALLWPGESDPWVARGGSWYDEAADLRSARRRASLPAWKKQDPQEPKSVWYLTDATWMGLRVVRPLAEPGEQEKSRYWEPVGEREKAILAKQRKGRE